MPPDENYTVPEIDANKIMHVSPPISKETILMGSDTYGPMAAGFIAGNNFSISINADNNEEAEKLFNGLSAGATVTMPLSKTFWSECFGMFADKLGQTG